MRDRRSMIGLSLFLVVAVALIWLTFGTLHRGVSGGTTSYAAVFSDVTGLKAGDDVRMAGVRVGRVDAVALDGDHARVRFRVQSDQKLYGNTEASITYQNVIGQRYLGLSLADYGDQRELRSGATIPMEHTDPSFDLSGLLNGFEPLFGGLDKGAVDNVTDALIKALQGDGGSLTTLIEQTSRLAESLAGPDQILGAVITNLNQVVRNLASRTGDVSALLTQTRTIIDGLSRHKDELTTSLTDIAATTGRIAQVVNADRPAVDDLLHRQPGFTQHFEDNKDEFAYLGFNLPALLKGLARVTQDGSYISAYLCNFGVTIAPALSMLIPTIVRAATPSGTIQQTPICR